MVNTLAIAPLHRPPGRGRRQRRSVDFLVDGISLHKATGLRDLSGCFSSDYADLENIRARSENERLLGIFLGEAASDLPRDRVALYTCPECSDLACGAETCQIEFRDAAVHWSMLAYENGYDDEEMTKYYTRLGPFEFDRGDYSTVIARAASAMPFG